MARADAEIGKLERLAATEVAAVNRLALGRGRGSEQRLKTPQVVGSWRGGLSGPTEAGLGSTTPFPCRRFILDNRFPAYHRPSASNGLISS